MLMLRSHTQTLAYFRLDNVLDVTSKQLNAQCEAIFTNQGKLSIWHNQLMNIVNFAKFMNFLQFMNSIFLVIM